MLKIICDDCGTVIFEWIHGREQKSLPDMDLWRTHLCTGCKKAMALALKELAPWEERQTGEYEKERTRRLQELIKKYKGR